MQDLTAFFLEALTHRDNWDSDRTRVELEAVMAERGGSVKWDRGAGEEWMKLFDSEQRHAGVVWAIAPLAIISPAVEAAVVRDLLERRGASVRVVADWDAPEFTIDPEAIRDAGLRGFWHADPCAVSASGFSILDLHYATD